MRHIEPILDAQAMEGVLGVLVKYHLIITQSHKPMLLVKQILYIQMTESLH